MMERYQPAPASLMVSSVSVTVTIWLSLMRMALLYPLLDSRARRTGLVDERDRRRPAAPCRRSFRSGASTLPNRPLRAHPRSRRSDSASSDLGRCRRAPAACAAFCPRCRSRPFVEEFARRRVEGQRDVGAGPVAGSFDSNGARAGWLLRWNPTRGANPPSSPTDTVRPSFLRVALSAWKTSTPARRAIFEARRPERHDHELLHFEAVVGRERHRSGCS